MGGYSETNNHLYYGSPVHLLHLNVGGKHFTSMHITLAGSKYLYGLIQRNYRKLEDHDEISIDRNGDLFRQVLFYLRTGLILPNDEEAIKQLLSEAKFYQCQNMVNALQVQLEKLALSQQTPTKKGHDFIDLKKMFDRAKSTYTLMKKTGDTVEAFSVVDYINVFSRNEYQDQHCKHGASECECYYYPKLVLVPQQKH